jgi:hypothetical protein
MTRIKSAILPKSEFGNDPNDNKGDPEYVNKIKSEPTALEKLKRLSVTNRIDEMEANLRNDVFIFPGLALSGQITLFYAWPNTGKTIFFLRFIRDAIKSGQIIGADVFYINADDSYKGLFTKGKVAKEFGFEMISPSEAGKSPNEILDLLVEVSADDDAGGKIVLLDTLKKFADMMSKTSQAHLYEVLRRFTAKGGTVIIAGHANKHKNPDGNLVYEGTGDTKNDVDCVYAMYQLSDPQDEYQVVEFRREKDRGDVIPKVSYRYKKAPGMHYLDMVNSITHMDDQEASRVATDIKINELKEKYEAEILFVTGLLKGNGAMNQSALLQALKANPDLSGEITGRSLKTALKKLTDIAWTAERGDKNALFFNLIGAEADQYRRVSRGE